MPAASTLTIADSVPGNHSFIPYQKDGMKVYWAEKTTPHTPAGFYLIACEYRVSNATSAVNRWDVSVATPVEALNSAGVWEVVGVNRSQTKILVYKGSTAQQIADHMAFTRNFLSNATVISAMAGSEGFY